MLMKMLSLLNLKINYCNKKTKNERNDMNYNMILYLTLIIYFLITIIFILLQHKKRQLEIKQFHYQKLIEDEKRKKNYLGIDGFGN